MTLRMRPLNTMRKAFVIRVGDKFVGPRHMKRALVDFDKAELYRYKKAAKRMAFLKKADEVMAVTIELEENNELN